MRRALKTGAATALVTLTAVSPAFAYGYGRNTIKPQYTYPGNMVTVHETTPAGAPSGKAIGRMWAPQTFDVEKAVSNESWCYGFAYGDINQRGWILCSVLSA